MNAFLLALARAGRPVRRYGSLATLTVVLIAACGGERRQVAQSADTSVAAAPPVSAPDTDAAVAPDTGRELAAVTDTSAATPEPASTVARRSTADTEAVARPAPAAKPAPAARPEATAPAKPEPAPAAPPAAPRQDTGAAEPTQDTAPAEPPEQDTAPAQPEPAAPAQPAQQAQATRDQPLRDEYHQAPRDTVSQEVYDGWKQYNLNCARCHGEDVLGTTIAPHLIMSVKPNGPINTKEGFIQVVCAGRPEKGMPAWCPLGMEMEKINQIYSYVKGRSEGEIGPGRPALRQEG